MFSLWPWSANMCCEWFSQDYFPDLLVLAWPNQFISSRKSLSTVLRIALSSPLKPEEKKNRNIRWSSTRVLSLHELRAYSLSDNDDIFQKNAKVWQLMDFVIFLKYFSYFVCIVRVQYSIVGSEMAQAYYSVSTVWRKLAFLVTLTGWSLWRKPQIVKMRSTPYNKCKVTKTDMKRTKSWKMFQISKL